MNILSVLNTGQILEGLEEPAQCFKLIAHPVRQQFIFLLGALFLNLPVAA